MNIDVRTDRRCIRTAWRSNRFVLARIEAPRAPADRPRQPVNIAFVVDRSGSMAGGKLELARVAVEQALARLHEDDRFAIVVYDETIDVVVGGTRATAEARRRAVDRLREIQPRGSTNLGEGWLRGGEQVALDLSREGMNRVLLLTDGLANVGLTDASELARRAGELRARGVSTTTFGVGRDFDERLLEAMAAAGGGNFYFIGDERQIPDFITSEVGEMLEVVARDVTLEVTAPAEVRVDSLTAHPPGRADGRTVVRLGDLVSEQVLDVVLRLNFGYGERGGEVDATFVVADRDGVLDHAGTRLAWQYADDRTNDLQERDREIDRLVARLFAARARDEALDLNRRGAYGEAQSRLRATARRIRDYAGRDSELRSIVAELERDATAWSAPMAAMEVKAAHFAASNVAHRRDVLGRAQKREP